MNTEVKNEIWLPIRNFEGYYEISNRFGKNHNQSKPLVVVIQDTSILEFESKTECAIYFNTTIQNVCRAMNGNGHLRGHKLTAI